MMSFFSLLIEISGKILLFNLWLLCDYWSALHNLLNDIQMTKISKILIFIPLWESSQERGTNSVVPWQFHLPPGIKHILIAWRTNCESFILVSPNAEKQCFSLDWSSTIMIRSLIAMMECWRNNYIICTSWLFLITCMW